MPCGHLRYVTASRLASSSRGLATAACHDDLFDVAIVGAGLTGAALAAGLGTLYWLCTEALLLCGFLRLIAPQLQAPTS